MDPTNPESSPQPPPAPPQVAPPLPPPPELLRPSVPHVPLTPMMDFLQRRLEALERELTVERESARSAKSQIQQQESLRVEVETHLKGMSDQLRREKAERETEEMKSHARGRVDALEKRLDEMHQSWVSLLKDAVTQRETGTQALLTGTIEKIGSWHLESQAFAKLLPEIKRLSQEIPECSQRFEAEVRQMLAQFSADLQERMASWQRHQEIEAERQAERLRQLSDERESLKAAWDQENHLLRQEQAKELATRENQVSARIAELAQRFEDQVQRLTMPPKAKDQLITDLELERCELQKSLQDRTQALSSLMTERRQVEAELRLQIDTERSQLTKAYALENEKVRSLLEERSSCEESWREKLATFEKRVSSEIELRAQAAASAVELKSKLSAMTEHLAVALEDKHEVHRLQNALKEKEQMISMLNSAFKNMLDKS